MGIPTLDELIEAVVANVLEDDPKERLSAAAEQRARLHELGDSLVAHFVEEARGRWCTWEGVGAVLGVSKQAAQQRFG
jgi:hypothetical protein